MAERAIIFLAATGGWFLGVLLIWCVAALRDWSDGRERRRSERWGRQIVRAVRDQGAEWLESRGGH